MRTLAWVLSSLVAASLAVPADAAGTEGSSVSAPAPATLVAVRAAHHRGFDRVVFEFEGAVPSTRRVRYVDELVGDGSGLPVPIAGRAVLQVSFAPATAHDASGPTVRTRKAFALPNVMSAVQAGDFEGVTTYGIGLAKRTSVRSFTLRNPSRVVVDVRAAFPTVARKVVFLNQRNYGDNTRPFFSRRPRPVRPGTPAVGVLDRLFAGPLVRERANGLVLLSSGATGFTDVAVADGVARVRLTGGCDSHGSTVTVADLIMPTLRQLASVTWVKIYDPAGTTQSPGGHTDSIPTCLEP